MTDGVIVHAVEGSPCWVVASSHYQDIVLWLRLYPDIVVRGLHSSNTGHRNWSIGPVFHQMYMGRSHGQCADRGKPKYVDTAQHALKSGFEARFVRITNGKQSGGQGPHRGRPEAGLLYGALRSTKAA